VNTQTINQFNSIQVIWCSNSICRVGP